LTPELPSCLLQAYGAQSVRGQETGGLPSIVVQAANEQEIILLTMEISDDSAFNVWRNNPLHGMTGKKN